MTSNGTNFYFDSWLLGGGEFDLLVGCWVNSMPLVGCLVERGWLVVGMEECDW